MLRPLTPLPGDAQLPRGLTSGRRSDDERQRVCCFSLSVLYIQHSVCYTYNISII